MELELNKALTLLRFHACPLPHESESKVRKFHAFLVRDVLLPSPPWRAPQTARGRLETKRSVPSWPSYVSRQLRVRKRCILSLPRTLPSLWLPGIFVKIPNHLAISPLPHSSCEQTGTQHPSTSRLHTFTPFPTLNWCQGPFRRKQIWEEIESQIRGQHSQTVRLLLLGPSSSLREAERTPDLTPEDQFKSLACYFLCKLRVALTLSGSRFPHLL